MGKRQSWSGTQLSAVRPYELREGADTILMSQGSG